MGRILSCPGSVEIVKLYPNEESAASNLGTVAHGILEDCVTFDTKPDHADPEINEGVYIALDFIGDKLAEYGKDCDLHTEKKLAIPDTPVWGTTDLVFVSPKVLHIADYKHGYVPVEPRLNAQLMSYLVGAIAEFGERSRYYVTVIQPRYHHAEGPVRTYQVTKEDLEWFRTELKYALENQDKIAAGKHCQKYYCPARGSCKVLAGFVAPRLNTAMDYELTDKHTFDNDTLAKLLEFADLAQGWLGEVRKEAFKRAMQDRKLGGWKIVRGKVTRTFTDDAPTKLAELYDEFGIPRDALYEASFVSPATVETQLKGHFKGRNKWKEYYRKVEQFITGKEGNPSLVRDSDGRPMFKRGDEFGELPVQEGDIIL
jgi:hypothetical protein